MTLATATGEMAYEILVNGADVSTMPHPKSAPKFTKKYNASQRGRVGSHYPRGLRGHRGVTNRGIDRPVRFTAREAINARTNAPAPLRRHGKGSFSWRRFRAWMNTRYARRLLYLELAKLLNAMPGAVSRALIWGLMAIGVYVHLYDSGRSRPDGRRFYRHGRRGAVAAMLIIRRLQCVAGDGDRLFGGNAGRTGDGSAAYADGRPGGLRPVFWRSWRCIPSTCALWMIKPDLALNVAEYSLGGVQRPRRTRGSCR